MRARPARLVVEAAWRRQPEFKSLVMLTELNYHDDAGTLVTLQTLTEIDPEGS